MPPQSLVVVYSDREVSDTESTSTAYPPSPKPKPKPKKPCTFAQQSITGPSTLVSPLHKKHQICEVDSSLKAKSRN